LRKRTLSPGWRVVKAFMSATVAKTLFDPVEVENVVGL
jgi:hypothetical protein